MLYFVKYVITSNSRSDNTCPYNYLPSSWIRCIVSIPPPRNGRLLSGLILQFTLTHEWLTEGIPGTKFLMRQKDDRVYGDSVREYVYSPTTCSDGEMSSLRNLRPVLAQLRAIRYNFRYGTPHTPIVSFTMAIVLTYKY